MAFTFASSVVAYSNKTAPVRDEVCQIKNRELEASVRLFFSVEWYDSVRF